jgi:putative tryptophan/tyrosine transport system substrate-binding protein
MSLYTRRAFLRSCLPLMTISAMGCGVLLPHARPAKIARLGYVSRGSDAAFAVPSAFVDGLRNLGYVEGHNIAIESRATERPEQYPTLVAELLQLSVDILVSGDSVALAAAKAATNTVPILMVGAQDPVEAGLVENLGRPGGNLTGTTLSSPGLPSKQLELLKLSFPNLSRVALLRDGSRPPNMSLRSTWATAADALGVELLELDVRQPVDLDVALEAAIQQSTDGIIPLRQPVINLQRARIIDFAARNRLPAMYPLREYADEGGLMAYGVEQAALEERAAAYVDKILKGASPRELPVERPTVFDFVVNQKTASALALIIPGSVLAQASEVIQ